MDVIFAADSSILSDDALLDAAFARATEERKQKAERCRFRKDQCACLGAELLLRRALERFEIHEIAYTYGAAGKPYLAGQSGVYFSLSHSGSRVLCAVSEHELGADIQTVGSSRLRIAERYFCQSEYRHIALQTTEEAKRALFYRYWTLKESFVKAVGLGLRLPLREFEIVMNGDISVRQAVDDRCFFFREYDEIPDCRCAVCSADAPFTAALEIVDLRECL